jgi:hypothetical protein
MNWFLMLVSAVAGGVVTWLWSVRKVRRQIPVYEPAPAPTADFVAAAAGSVPAAAPAEVATPVDDPANPHDGTTVPDGP